MSNTNDIFQVDYQPEKKEIRINLPEEFESGAFDADTSEVQRLRAALDWVKRRFEEEWTYELGTGEVVEEIIVKFEEALSTTTVQAERVREGDGNNA